VQVVEASLIAPFVRFADVLKAINWLEKFIKSNRLSGAAILNHIFRLSDEDEVRTKEQSQAICRSADK
jgi:hypothetical protein